MNINLYFKNKFFHLIYKCMNLKQLALSKTNDLMKQIQLLGLVTSKINEKPYNFEFTISKQNEKLKLQVYFGKKGIKIIIQGNKEAKLYSEVNQNVFGEELFSYPDKSEDEPEEYIGSDESGKGDVFGPLVVCAFYLNSKSRESLSEFEVRDSKDLSEQQITNIAGSIKNLFRNDFEIININPKKYNELYSQFKNLNSLLSWAHAKAINNLLNRNNCTEVIVDKFSNQPINLQFNKNSTNVNIFLTPKAERFIGVAAASILARDKFNQWFSKLGKKGILLPKGASELVDRSINKYNGNINELKKYAKIHFKNVKRNV